MLKTTLTIIQFAIGYYWAGDVARQHPSIDAAISRLENSYRDLNNQWQSMSARTALKALAAVHVRIMALAALMVFITGPGTALAKIFLVAGLTSALGAMTVALVAIGMSRTIARLWPGNPFFGLTALIFAGTSLVLLWI